MRRSCFGCYVLLLLMLACHSLKVVCQIGEGSVHPAMVASVRCEPKTKMWVAGGVRYQAALRQPWSALSFQGVDAIIFVVFPGRGLAEQRQG